MKGQKCSKAAAFIHNCFTPVATIITMCLRPGIFFYAFFCVWHVQAQEDSVRYLHEVQVHSTPVPEVKPASVPLQQLDAKALARIQAVQLSDVIKRFAGIHVKDYGGVGGLKTVSVRGLGANHTAFNYDGATINDSQTGQTDLGKFSLNNVDAVSLEIGNPHELLVPARAFASGSIITVKTARPDFKEKEVFHSAVNLRTGSFGLFAPVVTVQNKLSEKLSNSFLAEWQYADGRYPYTLDYGGITSNEKRHNTDVSAWHVEENLFAGTGNHKFLTKLYYYRSERGLPGATIFYNPHSSQRLWDNSFFIHSQLESKISDAVKTLVNLKATTAHLRYLDPDYLGTAGKIENNYQQEEYYGSVAAVYIPAKNIEIGLSTDGFYNVMDANLYQFAYPSRFTWLTSLHARYKTAYADVQAGALTTVVEEHTKVGSAAADQQRLSPSVMVGIRPLGTENLTFRFFYKEIFRMPTFNDLYYSGIGNKTLNPENTRQFNAGAVYANAFNKIGLSLSGSVDVYRNKVTDKIVAIPTKNLFIWTMMNIGVVEIDGIDVVLKAGRELGHAVSVILEGSYTHQQVLDKTDPKSKTYNDQIAYTPVHSGSATLSLLNPWVDVHYNALFSGKRYMLNHNIPPNLLNGYSEHGITLSKKVVIRKVENVISFEALNVFDKQYEVVRNFPMAGRSYRISVSIKF